jgi:hypothetical protein
MTPELFFTEVSEAVSLPQDARQGIFDARGKMVLAFKTLGPTNRHCSIATTWATRCVT